VAVARFLEMALSAMELETILHPVLNLLISHHPIFQQSSVKCNSFVFAAIWVKCMLKAFKSQDHVAYIEH
jgi:hypothetical protein